MEKRRYFYGTVFFIVSKWVSQCSFQCRWRLQPKYIADDQVNAFYWIMKHPKDTCITHVQSRDRVVFGRVNYQPSCSRFLIFILVCFRYKCVCLDIQLCITQYVFISLQYKYAYIELMVVPVEIPVVIRDTLVRNNRRNYNWTRCHHYSVHIWTSGRHMPHLQPHNTVKKTAVYSLLRVVVTSLACSDVFVIFSHLMMTSQGFKTNNVINNNYIPR